MGVKDERSELTPDYLVGTCLALLVCLVSKRAFVSITRCSSYRSSFSSSRRRHDISNIRSCTSTGGLGGNHTDEMGSSSSSSANTSAGDLPEWNRQFTEIQQKQLAALTELPAVKAQLEAHGLFPVFRTWSDVGRAKGSCIGDNITDMQFFALSPARPAGTSHVELPSEHFVPFPAIRPPNYSDEVDIRTAGSVRFKAKDRWGQLHETTLEDFLKCIGKYVADLPEEADWSDPADKGPMQAAAQFSMLPAPTGRADLGVAAFGYQAKNLHIIIGPGGEVGWSPEGRGATRVFFKQDSQLRAVSLVPEDRTEVKERFFEAPKKDETIEQEASRYKRAENKLLHIQVQMDRPAGSEIARGKYKASLDSGMMDSGMMDFLCAEQEELCCAVDCCIESSALEYKADTAAEM